MQDWLIEGLDPVIDDLQYPIALGGLMLGQDATGQERNNGQGHDKRGPHCAKHRDGQGANIGPRTFWQGHERQKRQHQTPSAANHRKGNLASAINRRRGAVLALAQPPGNVFGYDNGVIDQEAKR